MVQRLSPPPLAAWCSSLRWISTRVTSATKRASAWRTSASAQRSRVSLFSMPLLVLIWICMRCVFLLWTKAHFAPIRRRRQSVSADAHDREERHSMAIQWFPGHMHLTQKAIEKRLKDIDVVIELLDARLPGSSANPMLAELTGHKPGLKVLNKQDLADPAVTALWLAHYDARAQPRAISLDASQAAPARQLVDACHQLAPSRGGMAKPMRVLICGIPNVGKST